MIFVNPRTQTPAKKLKLLLIERDLQLSDLASGTGISISLIKKIAAGRRTPTTRTAARVETFFGERIFSSPAAFRARLKALQGSVGSNADTTSETSATQPRPVAELTEKP
jgi:transcriptional regulator with XRE-family HTH domain